MSSPSSKVLDFPASNSRRSRLLDVSAVPAHSKQEHDLRNFLYLATSFTELLRDGLGGPVTAQQKQFLGHVLDCTQNMKQLLDQLTCATAQADPASTSSPFAIVPASS